MNATSLRETLQRLLGLIPTLFLVSVVAFWSLSLALHSSGPNAQERDVPLFWNPSPVGVGTRSREIAERIARGDSEHGAELVRIGGAALPELMPHLDSLLPQQRARVAFALAPLAVRMGIAEPDELKTPDDAAAFWNRYWTDHFIDFRPQVVERAVTRLAQRPSLLRRAEVQRLDTFALPALMQALEDSDDTPTQRELLAAAARISGQTWHSEAETEVQASTTRALQWWTRERRHFESYQGARRLVAMLQETQYGRWVVAGVRGRMPGASHDWRLEPTLALIGTGIVGSYFLGPLLAAWTATAATGRRAALAISLFLASVPAAAAADWLRLSGMTHRALALVAMLVLGAGMLCLYQYQATRDAFSHDFVQTHRAFGASRLRAALGALRSSSLVSAAHLANHGPGLFAAACVVEWAFDWHGLGWLALTAVHERDIATLTWIALFGTLLSGLLHIMSDLLQSRFERGHEARP